MNETTHNGISDERSLLLLLLEHQRTAFRNAMSGLTEEQARSVPSASEMSLSSLLKHVIDGEESMTARVLGTPRAEGPTRLPHGRRPGMSPRTKPSTYSSPGSIEPGEPRRPRSPRNPISAGTFTSPPTWRNG